MTMRPNTSALLNALLDSGFTIAPPADPEKVTKVREMMDMNQADRLRAMREMGML